jgi:PAS domain S-box-containing protein
MGLEQKTKEQLIEELKELNRRVDSLEKSIAVYREDEESLKQREEQYRSMVESTDDSIYLVNREYEYLFMNKQHISRLGVAESSYLGKKYGEFHSPDENNTFVEKIDQVFRSGVSLQYQHRSLRNGKYFLRTLSPIKDEHGMTTAVNIISKDVNELKKAEFERDKIIFELQEALTQIKTLKGLIPICAWCKKIRDDSGYWKQLESYLQEHSEADFTHGMCEECFKTMHEKG